MAKSMTEAQQHNLDTFRRLGGTLNYHKSFRWFVPGEAKPIQGLHAVAIKSLIGMGLLVKSESGSDTILYSVSVASKLMPKATSGARIESSDDPTMERVVSADTGEPIASDSSADARSAAGGQRGDTTDERVKVISIGASMIVSFIREAYEKALDTKASTLRAARMSLEYFAETKAIEAFCELMGAENVARVGLPVVSDMARKIGRRQATLRGYTDTGITYHDTPCASCGSDPAKAAGCIACNGDGFAPAIGDGA